MSEETPQRAEDSSKNRNKQARYLKFSAVTVILVVAALILYVLTRSDPRPPAPEEENPVRIEEPQPVPDEDPTLSIEDRTAVHESLKQNPQNYTREERQALLDSL